MQCTAQNAEEETVWSIPPYRGSSPSYCSREPICFATEESASHFELPLWWEMLQYPPRQCHCDFSFKCSVLKSGRRSQLASGAWAAAPAGAQAARHRAGGWVRSAAPRGSCSRHREPSSSEHRFAKNILPRLDGSTLCKGSLK